MKLWKYGRGHEKGRVILLPILLVFVLGKLSMLNLTVSTVSAAISPYIGVMPESTVDETITPGMNYTVSIYTDYDGADVWGYEFKLTYNPDVLEGIEVVNGDIITGGTVQFVTAGFNNTSGELDLSLGFFFFMMPPPPLTSGPGILANVTFSVVGYGSSDITLATEPSDPERTKLKGYWFNDTMGDWVLFNIIDSGTMLDQIQHGFFSNERDIATTIDVDPDTLNLRSEGQWITAFIELPEGYNVSNIDIYSIMLNDTIPVSLLPNPPVPVPTEIGDYDEDGAPDLMVKFNRALVQSFIYNQGVTYGEVALTIAGELFDGTPFEGADVIFVNYAGDANSDGMIDIFDVGAVSAHWYPGPPTGILSYGSDADFNTDNAVDIFDIGILCVNWKQTTPS